MTVGRPNHARKSSALDSVPHPLQGVSRRILPILNKRSPSRSRNAGAVQAAMDLGSPWFRVSGDVVLAGHAASRAVA